MRNIAQLTFETGTLRLLSGTDCVKDRLAHYFHWRDRQCLEQASLMATSTAVDIVEIERWVRHEGFGSGYALIKPQLIHRPPDSD